MEALRVGEDTEVLIDTEVVTPEEVIGEVVTDSDIGAKLDKLHMDMWLVIFLLIVFWSYKEIKLGFRNLGKFSKR